MQRIIYPMPRVRKVCCHAGMGILKKVKKEEPRLFFFFQRAHIQGVYLKSLISLIHLKIGVWYPRFYKWCME